MKRLSVLEQAEQLEKVAVAFSNAADRLLKAVEQSEGAALKKFQAKAAQVRDHRREVEEVLQRGVQLTNKRFNP